MGIKLILYVVLMDYNRFKVDTGSTSGFAQKNFFRMFKSMETSDSCIEKSILYVFRGTEAESDAIKVLSAFLISEKCKKKALFYKKMQFLHQEEYFRFFLCR